MYLWDELIHVDTLKYLLVLLGEGNIPVYLILHFVLILFFFGICSRCLMSVKKKKQ